MKRIIIFIGLKIAEIGGFLIVWLWLRELGHFLLNSDGIELERFSDYAFEYFLTPFFALLAIGSFVGVTCLLALFIKYNWDLAKKYTRKWK